MVVILLRLFLPPFKGLLYIEILENIRILKLKYKELKQFSLLNMVLKKIKNKYS